jgi:PAS domain S-box-containing protein
MRLVWANATMRSARSRAGCQGDGHCFDVWRRDRRCLDCLPLVAFRTGEPAEGLRERGCPGEAGNVYWVRALPVRDDAGEPRWVLESLVKLSSLQPALARRGAGAALLQAPGTGGAFMVVDASDRIVSWSPAAAALFGYEVDEVLGRGVALLIPEDRAAERRWIAERVAADGQVDKLETVRRAKDGRLVPVSLSARALRDDDGTLVGRATVVGDLSALRAQQEVLAHMARAAGDAVIGVGSDRLVTSWSPAAEQMLGVEAAAALGRPLAQVVRQPAQDELLGRLAARASVCGERTSWHDAQGRERAVEVTALKLTVDGAAVLVVRDIGRQLREQRQMMRSEKLAAVGSLAAGLAHEIGTPLNVISATAEWLLAARPGDGSWADELRKIVGETERISKLVQDLLSFARGSRTRWDLVRPGEAVERAVRLLRIQLERKQITVQTEIGSELPPVRSEPDGLHQVLVNLLLNAVRAVPEQGAIRIRATAVGPREGGEERAVTLEVHDSGPGVPSELRERIFDPFFTTHADGTGLGLAVCARIVAAIGGDIRVTDGPLGGACFILHLPAAIDETVAAPTEPR